MTTVKWKLLVTGSRTITDAAVVDGVLDKLAAEFPEQISLVIHGGAKGVDTLAGAWARRHNIPVQVVLADHSAGYSAFNFIKRDWAMVDLADRVVGVWDGSSPGTKKTMDYAEKKGKLHLKHITV